MDPTTRSHPAHKRAVYLWILSLLALSCLGFFIESRSEVSPKTQAQMQGLIGPDTTAMGLSGGRARGGSFDSPAPSSPSGGGFPSGGGGFGGGSYPVPRSYPDPAPYPSYPGYTSYPVTSIGSSFGFFILLAILGFTVLPMLMTMMRLGSTSRSSYAGTSPAGELYNDTVTITQLQVALLAQARSLQAELTALAERADLDNKAGLNRLLQESVLALLRSPEYWSHARVVSKTVQGRQQATQVFEQLSLAERSKFSRETLSNVDGRVNRQAMAPKGELAAADYIVVTLIVGTADDRPLFDQQIYSTTDLQTALKRLGAIAPDYLMVYELLWSPQDASDSLSYDQMLAAYPDMVQI